MYKCGRYATYYNYTVNLLAAAISSCDYYQYKCHSGECVSQSSQCDGRYQCSDHSDEDDCGKYSIWWVYGTVVLD